MEPIAVIGIGCRFPGARDPETFWQLLQNGVDAITEVPAGRFDLDAFYEPLPTPGKIITRWGGFLEEVDRFDPSFFSISPREAVSMDPQQRLLLEVAWEAIEDAGLVSEQLKGSQTGVFIGMITNDYEDLHYRQPDDIDVYIVTGACRSVASGRLSYVLGTQGPSMTIDTACSSSLLAVHLACQSLRAGESTLALAGGANLVLMPEPSFGFSIAGMLAPDGRCKFGDASGNGFVRSDGVGVVALKLLSKAQADGDPIHAVIIGSATNNDGQSGGLLMAPSLQGQEEVLRLAYAQAGVSPREVQYVEAHGTGTSVGDPVELGALGKVFAENGADGTRRFVGSVKTNIGHTEGTAGVAGLIKAALCLKHKAIPPNLHFHQPNPNIPWESLPFQITRDLCPWPETEGPRRAAVSSFGISGTNVHAILEEAPPAQPVPEETGTPTRSAALLTLSAHTRESLEALAKSYQSFVTAAAGDALADICYTASVRRSHHDYRLSVVATEREEFREQLEAFLQGEARPGLSVGEEAARAERKLVFVFPGQGSQWFGMGRQLLEEEPFFRAAIEQCDAAMRSFVDWSLLEELAADGSRSRLDQIDVVQPTLFALGVALATLWRSWGIEPDAVVGTSMGEVAAAHVAGVLSLEDAARIICLRSKLLRRASGQGAMATVELSLEGAREALAGYEDRLSIAVSNSPVSTVLSGDPQALNEVIAKLESRDVFCRLVKVDVASHSPQMEPLRADLSKALEGLQPRTASLKLYSTVLNRVGEGHEFDTDYWVRNLREPVLFSPVVQQLLEEGHNVFLEMSPHPILLPTIQQGMLHAGVAGEVLPSLRREEEERAQLLSSLGALYTLGQKIDWSRFYKERGRCVRLPSYPWQRESYWIAEEKNNASGRRRFRARRDEGAGHPFLSFQTKLAHPPETYLFEIDLDPERLPYLQDHQVQGTIVLPGTAYIEMALAGASEAFGEGAYVLGELQYQRALFLSSDTPPPQVQMTFSREAHGTTLFRIHSRMGEADQTDELWTLHVSGRINQSAQAGKTRRVSSEQIATIRTNSSQEISGADFYRQFADKGNQWNAAFQGIERLWIGDGEVLAQVYVPDELGAEIDKYRFHPAVLDACCQIMAVASPSSTPYEEADAFLLGSIDRVDIHARPGGRMWSRVLPGVERQATSLKGDIEVIDETGNVIAELHGVRLQYLEEQRQAHAAEEISSWFYEPVWEEIKVDARPPAPWTDTGAWLILTDGSETSIRLQAQLESLGETCFTVSVGDSFDSPGENRFQVNPGRPEDFRLLFEELSGKGLPPVRAVVHLWSLHASAGKELTTQTLLDAQLSGCGGLLHLLQALNRPGQNLKSRLFIVTSGAHPVERVDETVAVAQSPIWGLGRVILREHPELRCKLLDLSASVAADESDVLLREFRVEDDEDQIALRSGKRYALRLSRYKAQTGKVAPAGRSEGEPLKVVGGEKPFRLEMSEPGILDNLKLQAVKRETPRASEVEIEVVAAGVNFRDIMLAMNLIPAPLELGLECAGKIVRLGEGVEGFEVGDEVLAIATPSFGTFANTHAALVFRKPARLSFEEAATIPTAFLTAYYALYHVGRLRAGERVLIHSAAGGVGLAAIQVARWLGAEVIATAGTQEKREFLRSLGIQHVLDSHSLSFADHVLELTGGEGVDCILNSLAGEFISRGLSTLRPYGRFLELGKADILQNTQLGLQHFRNNISFSAVDVFQLFTEQPEIAGVFLREIMQHVAEGTFQPLPLQVFPISEVESAFRLMARGGHTGKLVVSLTEDVPSAASEELPSTLDADGAYLITGGLGGIGFTVARWMVERGARSIILMGRKGLPPRSEWDQLDQESRQARQVAAVRELEMLGATVHVAAVDVADEAQLSSFLNSFREREGLRLRGVVHAAGVVQFKPLLETDLLELDHVLRPKVTGGWLLHKLTQDSDLDFFILFSSGSTLLSSPLLGSYAAANVFLDALAHHRRAHGQTALSINWGFWAEVGMAADFYQEEGRELVPRGMSSFTPEQGMRAFELLIEEAPVQAAVLRVNWPAWKRSYPEAGQSPLLKHLVGAKSAAPAQTSVREVGTGEITTGALRQLGAAERLELLQANLREQVARVLRLSAAKLNLTVPLNKLGLDSLMAVELKNRIQTAFGVTIPVVKFLHGATVMQLSEEILDHLLEQSPVEEGTQSHSTAAVSLTSSVGSSTQTPSNGDNDANLLARIDELSDEEVERALSQMLAEDRMKE